VLNCKKKYKLKKILWIKSKGNKYILEKKSRKRRIQKKRGEFNTTLIAILFLVYWYLLAISLSLRVSVLSHLNLFLVVLLFSNFNLLVLCLYNSLKFCLVFWIFFVLLSQDLDLATFFTLFVHSFLKLLEFFAKH